MVEFCQNRRPHAKHTWWCIKDVMTKTGLGANSKGPIYVRDH